MVVFIIIYLILYTVGLIYFLKSDFRKDIHEKTNNYFTNEFIVAIICLYNLGLVGFGALLVEGIRQVKLWIGVRATYKLLERFHKQGKITDEAYKEFLDIKKGKTNDRNKES